MVSKKENPEELSTQLSAKIWGHRFRDGQKGPEYVLEFLNVLKGTDYDFSASNYSRVRSTGLRQFIFEGNKEGSKDGIVSLTTEQKDSLYKVVENKDKLNVIRDFFRNLEIPLTDGTGKPANRSWYAKTLYPLHESLLYFELRTQTKDDKKTYSFERNFFARGGELYFLMLSYGTENNRLLRSNIEERLRELLSKNKAIEGVVKKITNCLDDNSKLNNEYYPLKKELDSNREYPMLPTTDDPIYEEFAEEFSRLINLNIDIYELFELMTSLITFQLGRYMLKKSTIHDEKITFFFDCLDAQVGPIQKLSSKSFSNNELLIKNKFEDYFKHTFTSKISSKEFVENNLAVWKNDPAIIIDLLGLNRLSKVRKNKIEKVIQKCKTYSDVMNYLFNTVKEIVSDQLKKHQLNIVRGLTRDGGYGGFRRGSKYRYYMSDTFIQALVYANLDPQSQEEFHTFLEKIYQKYGFIIGEIQAKEDGTYESSKLNVSYFHRNEYALREKLRHNGLLVEYSDATAMIRNPYEKAAGVVQ
ncbi:hypothetical protein P6709_09960 [Jeotgalibacillus sp. ET6]|uniref:hypothetical protein n=1 Tax=Jeotgalibacillus sp. ET6 TaxID=3037260 RepID=UPI0024186C4B|nr:hypothetical protein [Jeotgalibacillus sp. ET6]MDG5472076.1 hypothetical protein [Jeotgalibacillus sp. ET6]